MIKCSHCSTDIDPGGAAVVNDRGANPHYVGFVEDLRGSPSELCHVRCFTEMEGVDELFGAVHREDQRRRSNDLAARPNMVWIPQATLQGHRDDVNIYDIGAFTSEAVALDAAKVWASENSRSPEPEIVLNLVPVYDTVVEWRSDF